MSKLTAGDCVAILGRQWGESEGIITAADRVKPATKEQQNLAEWATNIAKPKQKVNATDHNADLKVIRRTIVRGAK